MTSTLAGAGIQLSAHGAFRESIEKSTPDSKKIGHRHSSGNRVIEKIVRRRAIVVLAQADVNAPAITTFIGTSKNSVYRWNNRCVHVNNYKDNPRSVRPSSYTEAALQVAACSQAIARSFSIIGVVYDCRLACLSGIFSAIRCRLPSACLTVILHIHDIGSSNSGSVSGSLFFSNA